MPKNQWNAALYESRHSFVWQYGADLIELLAPQQGERILDLGCGTGQLTCKIATSGAEVVGIDSAPTMIEQACQNYPNLRFEVADGTNFHFQDPFNAVFSNAVLHWIKAPERAVACIWRALKPGGRVVVEFGGKGNTTEITHAIYDSMEAFGYAARPELNPWYFPSVGEYSTLLEKQGFCVTYATLFDRPTPLTGGTEGMRNWIQMFAGNFLLAIPSNQHTDFVQSIEYRLRPKLYRDGTWFVDYKRIRVIAIKEQAI